MYRDGARRQLTAGALARTFIEGVTCALLVVSAFAVAFVAAGLVSKSERVAWIGGVVEYVVTVVALFFVFRKRRPWMSRGLAVGGVAVLASLLALIMQGR